MNIFSDKEAFWTMIRTSLLYLAWTTTLVATLGSLLFSEVMNFIPCELCWYQRIFMYPIILILTVGILLRDKRVVFYTLPLCVIGLVISVYHNLLYYNVISQGWHVCTAGVPCETRWIQWFGFVGIPFLALTSFVIVILCLLWYQSPNESSIEKESSENVITTMPSWILNSLSVVIVIGYFALLIIAATNGS